MSEESKGDILVGIDCLPFRLPFFLFYYLVFIFCSVLF